MVVSAHKLWVDEDDENLCEICRDDLNCEKCTCNVLKIMCNLLVTTLINALLLIT